MTNELTDDELREAIVRHEWDQFQRTNNEGGRAACQGNWPVFHQMRLAQFLTWERPLLTSYAADLDAADHVGRNLVTEKYGRNDGLHRTGKFHEEHRAVYSASL